VIPQKGSEFLRESQTEVKGKKTFSWPAVWLVVRSVCVKEDVCVCVSVSLSVILESVTWESRWDESDEKKGTAVLNLVLNPFIYV